MKIRNTLAGALTAGIVLSLMGWLVYGTLLKDVMSEMCENSINRPMDQMIWWALLLSNLVSGLLLAVLLQWSNSLTIASGAKVGAVVGLLTGLGFDLMMYSMTTMFSDITFIFVDAPAFALINGVAGLAAAWVMGKMGK